MGDSEKFVFEFYECHIFLQCEKNINDFFIGLVPKGKADDSICCRRNKFFSYISIKTDGYIFKDFILISGM